MPETGLKDYQSIPDLEQSNASWKKFLVKLEGKTNGAHENFVNKFKSIGHKEVDSHENSDYILLFCPIVSRVGTDISEALEKIPDNKPTILVVMHQTFDPDHVVADSQRLVENRNVKLAVDCLFYQGKLLNSNRNENAWAKVKNFLEVPQASTLDNIFDWCTRNWKLIAVVAVCFVVAGSIISGVLAAEKS